jgi:hypothetical protein
MIGRPEKIAFQAVPSRIQNRAWRYAVIVRCRCYAYGDSWWQVIGMAIARAWRELGA